MMNFKSIKKFWIKIVLIFICCPSFGAYFWFQNDQWVEGETANQAVILEFCEEKYRGDYVCATFEIDRDCTIDKIGVLFAGTDVQPFNFWIRAYEGDGISPFPGTTIPPPSTPIPRAQYTVEYPGFYIFDLSDSEVQWQIERKAGEKLVICLEYLGTMNFKDINKDICTDIHGISPGINYIWRCEPYVHGMGMEPEFPDAWQFAEDFGFTNNFIIRAGWEIPDPTSTPSPTMTPTPVPTRTPTNTPTDTPTCTPTPTEAPTNTPTDTPTMTPNPTDTPTQVPTFSQTPVPTMTPSAAPTSEPTFTPAPSATITVTPHSPTQTPVFTATPKPTSTSTPETPMTPTPTWPTETPSVTPTSVPTYEPFRLPFVDDFESILPWETESLHGECLWHRDIVRYYSPYFAWAYNRGQPTFDYDTGARNSCSLVSPRITLINSVQPELTYMDWIQNEERLEFDICSTEITIDGGQTWHILFETYDKTELWTRRGPFDLTPYRGNIVQIRFRFDSMDSQFNNFEGWYIDDVSVREWIDPTPTPQTPTCTPIPTATPDTSGRHGLELILNERVFYAAMIFHLEMILTNTTAVDISVDTYIVLDVYGTYWFWPSWDDQKIDMRPDVLVAGKSTRETILWFEWPEYNGSFDDCYLWGATLSAGTSELVGELDYVIFGCNL